MATVDEKDHKPCGTDLFLEPAVEFENLVIGDVARFPGGVKVSI